MATKGFRSEERVLYLEVGCLFPLLGRLACPPATADAQHFLMMLRCSHPLGLDPLVYLPHLHCAPCALVELVHLPRRLWKE